MGVYRIALSGKMRSGKDTIADYLVKRYGFVRVAFADKLKEIAVDLFGKPENSKNREVLVALGRKMCQIDKAVWVRHVLQRIPFDRDVVISDLRFPEEYYALKALDFSMVRVEISEDEQERRIQSSDPTMPRELKLDYSETALDVGWKFDYGVDGGKSWPNTMKDVDLVLEKIKCDRYLEAIKYDQADG